MRRWALAALLLGGAWETSVAQELSSEPSSLACADFRSEMQRVLAAKPNSLQINNLLFEAAHKGCAASLETLFEAGASRLARDRRGDTAMAIAARMGRAPVVDALLKSASPAEAAQIDIPDVVGSTPLIVAALADRNAVALRLIEAGADVNAANHQGETALSIAAYNGNLELAAALIDHHARADTIDVTGKGVICYAAGRGADRIVEKLLDAGIEPNARYRGELTALMWAAGHADNAPLDGGLRTVKLLLARGAKVDLVDDRGRSALMIAAGLGHAEIVKTLIEAGADRTLRDKAGKTAVDLATSPEIKAILAPS